MQGKNITGRTKSTEHDLYETPAWATKKITKRLLEDKVLEITDVIDEVCCGAGAITKVLEEFGFKVNQSDIQDEDYITGEKSIDVYKINDKSCNIVFTNPPYNHMTKENMLAEFLRISKNKVILLLNIFYLSSGKRKELLENSPLKYIYIHSDRVTMFPYGETEPINGGTKMFAWYVWEHGYKGEPIIRWL